MALTHYPLLKNVTIDNEARIEGQDFVSVVETTQSRQITENENEVTYKQINKLFRTYEHLGLEVINIF